MPKPAFQQGTYQATISNWLLGKSKQKKTPYIRFFFRVQETTGRSLERSTDLYFTEKTVDRTVEILRSLGYPHQSFAQLEPAHPEGFHFNGKEITVECGYQEYNGEDQERWQFPLTGQVVPLERKDISQLDATFSQNLKQTAPPVESTVWRHAQQGADSLPKDASRQQSSAEQAEEIF